MSLKNAHKKVEEIKVQKETEDFSNLPKEDFTFADFYVYWKKYIGILEKQGDKMLASILNSSKPDLNDTNIKLVYPNQMMLEEVRKNQVHVLNYLRGKLRNYQIKFELVLDEATEKSYAYTPQEKYAKLREINPLIDDLRKNLHLDI